jgi:SAM-dependent methyltransferase
MLDSIRPYSLPDYYLTSIAVGLKSLLSGHPREALARVLNPLSYPRLMEYQLALDQLGPLDGCRVLDIGSPKLATVVVARNARCELHSTDIRDYFIPSTAQFLRSTGLGHRLGRDLHLETQDARRLSYADGSFDRVFSISVLEHIPDDGDARAMREIARVLRPGGLVTLTVPFSDRGHRDEYVNGDVYERAGTGVPTFYQRYYDRASLFERLIEPSGLTVLETTFFGEPNVRFEPYWTRIPLAWKVPLLWAQPFLEKLFLARLGTDRLDAACGVALKLQKPAARSPRPADVNTGPAFAPASVASSRRLRPEPVPIA